MVGLAVLITNAKKGGTMARLLAVMIMACFLMGCATSQADLLVIERSVDTDIIVGKTTREEVLARWHPFAFLWQ